MIRKLTGSVALAVVALSLLATSAFATVTFDPATGTGFVGKGDLQVPWGWSNQTLQAQAGNVSFSYVSVTTNEYDVTCEWDTGTRNVVHHTVDSTSTTTEGVNDAIGYDARTNKQSSVTGFTLTGLSSTSTTTSGEVPAVGDTTWCNANEIGPQGTPVTDVELISSSTSSTLYASDSAAGTGPTAIWIDGASVQP